MYIISYVRFVKGKILRAGIVKFINFDCDFHWISATQQQAMMTAFFFLLPFFMLNGFVFPIANMPVVVQWLTYLNPLMYFLNEDNLFCFS